MSIPGRNLLKTALKVIASTPIVYYQALGRTLNAVGQDVTTYNSPLTLLGSWQAVPRSLYEQYGLDLQKTYFNFFVSKELVDIERDVSNDLLVYQNNVYQCQSATEWFGIDGWIQMISCKSGLPIPGTFGD